MLCWALLGLALALPLDARRGGGHGGGRGFGGGGQGGGGYRGGYHGTGQGATLPAASGPRSGDATEGFIGLVAAGLFGCAIVSALGRKRRERQERR